jgi:hypothetical protein
MSARPRLVPRGEPEITCDEYPRITPGEYYALCTSSKIYRDGLYKRWVLRLRWNVLPSNSCFEPIARDVPMFISLGERAKPHASRRGKYWNEWIRANGGPPCRGDRLSPKIFKGRVARIQVADTDSAAAYSVVRSIISFETGASLSFSHVVSQSGSQVRQGVSACTKN